MFLNLVLLAPSTYDGQITRFATVVVVTLAGRALPQPDHVDPLGVDAGVEAGC